MTFDSCYQALDRILPGGTIDNLDRSVVLDRKLYLTRMAMDGLQDMHEYSQDKRLYRHFEFGPFTGIDATRAYLQKLIDRMGEEVNDRKFMYWFIRLIENHKVIGSICLVDIDVQRDSAAWGYAISPQYWGRGHILEAQLLVISYFFEILKLNRLWGITTTDNQSTISSVLAAGFQKEGILRDYYKMADGRRKDGFIYSLLARDYENIKGMNSGDRRHKILTLDSLKLIFSRAFGVVGSKIDMDTAIDTLAEWDSLNHVVLISLIERETSLKFKPVEIANATSVRSILDIVNNGGKTSGPC